MRIFSKLTARQWTGLLFVLFLGGVGLLNLPAGAQDDPKPATAENDQPAEKSASDEAPADAPVGPTPPETKELFKEARRKLATRMYRAKIVQLLHFPDRSLEAKGKIVRGDKYRMRLEFEIHAGPTVGKLLQVSNGDKLWTQRRVNDVTKLTVQDVKEILTRASADKNSSDETKLVVAEMGLGGITGLLASMDRTLNFGAPQSVEVDGEQLKRVDGVWNETFRSRLQSNPQLGKNLPNYIPDGARVYFDRDHFPRRIQYLKEDEEHDVMQPVVTIDFVDVQWLAEADVDPADFEYEPPERVYPEDVTKAYLDQLKGQTQTPAPGPARQAP